MCALTGQDNGALIVGAFKVIFGQQSYGFRVLLLLQTPANTNINSVVLRLIVFVWIGMSSLE